MFGDSLVMLSPSVAETGMIVTFSRSKSIASFLTSFSRCLYLSLSYPTRSILLTANTKWRIPMRAHILLCRIVWGSMPLVASRSTIARSAKDAPTAMFRVYSSWPGVSATMKLLAFVVKYR